MFRRFGLFAVVLLCVAMIANAQVVINEFYYDNPGAEDATVKFVELYGPSGTNLSGWSIVGINGSNGQSYLTVQLTGTIPADGYYVIGGSAVSNVDQQASIELQNAGFGSDRECDAVELRNGATTVDHVCYGICTGAYVCVGTNLSNAPDYDPPASGPAKSDARMPDHSDTDLDSVDFQVSDPMTPGAPNSGAPCDPQYVSLNEIRDNDGNGQPALLGDFVIVSGIVNVNNFVFDDSVSSFYLQDDDAGCNVFGGSVPEGIAEGDCVIVSAWVAGYNGLTELYYSGSGNCAFSVEVTNHGADVDATVITGASFFESFEGMLVRMNNITIIDGTWPGAGQWANLTVTDGSGTIVVRIDDDTQVDGTPAPVGAFDIMGILTQFDSSSPFTDGYQITPRYPTDVLYHEAVDDTRLPAGVSDFALYEAYPNPFNSNVRVRFEVGRVRDLSLSIYDVLGREVVSEKLMNLAPGMHNYSWSPTGSTGLYLVRLSSDSKVETGKLLYLK